MGKYAGFSKVELRKPERSKFDLSHEKKLSCRMGQLVPVFVSETLPNDTFRVNSEVMLRFAPLLAPIYHRVNVFVHFFFIPTRLLYADWEAFITNGRLGTETAPVPPYLVIGDVLGMTQDNLDKGSVADYLGVRPIPDADAAAWSAGGDRAMSMLPFAAYYKVWYDYYRDRNYRDDTDYLPLPSGEIVAATQLMEDMLQLKTRAWQHDYFTSALPFTQRGDDVLIPMEADVEYMAQSVLKKTVGGTAPTDGGIRSAGGLLEASVVGEDIRIENIQNIANSTVTINDLRQAIRLQEWFEKSAVAGSRYNENIMAHFARRTSDGRLQRAEYLGGGRVPVQISEVMTTAFSEDGDANVVPPATMTGRGATYLNKAGFKYNCEEHGLVLGIMSVMPNSGYMQGVPRMFQKRNTFLDYPWPSFAHLGEQEVYEYEVYATPDTYPVLVNADDPTLFGYQSRYSDWKWIASTAHGDFRDTLDYWHLDRKFSGVPTLDEDFVTFEDALQDRVFAVSGVDTLWCYVHNAASVVRSLPYFGTPRL